MDYSKKSSIGHKETEARKILQSVKDSNCSNVPVAMKVPRPDGNEIFDGAVGISIAGKETNIAIPSLAITIDAGRNVEKVLERDLLVSHFDADHVEGIGRAICNAINRKSKLDIFLPSMNEHAELKKIVRKFKRKDNLGLVKIHEMKEGDAIKRRGKEIKAFKILHSPESLGYVVSVNDNGNWNQKLTYTGDVDPGKMNMAIPEILDSETVLMDGSLTGALLSFLEPIISTFTNHASTGDIVDLARNENSKIRNIGIIHLPMIGCNAIREDLDENFASDEKNVFYLQSCRKAGKDPLHRMTSFKQIDQE